MLCYAMLCYAMLCYAMLCYAMLCYAMLCCAVAEDAIQALSDACFQADPDGRARVTADFMQGAAATRKSEETAGAELLGKNQHGGEQGQIPLFLLHQSLAAGCSSGS